MKTNIGISNQNTGAVADILARLLADEYVLYTKTQKAHWNLEGMDFHTQHLYLETQYNQVHDFVDAVAERMRKIGHYAPGTLKEFLELTHLTEHYQGKNDTKGYFRELLEDHESIIVFIREHINPVSEKYKDEGTADFLTGLMEDHEKIAWMLRATVA
ncbi:Dps family protein [Sinomicrobium soli]|uniref:Dps family protein n=1 Tax=Sinomicrobium sp. N-1-3-6 TaxID=2219864 RepID=UPI000DCC02D5|nr:DNA starvation/stationary phase protection protein [Sinomicrobium sp. N-1-3-6]RAV29024.1 DNA starvation/stationary phase protection protein [Sinomicrobium sp. N-1-3-6]